MSVPPLGDVRVSRLAADLVDRRALSDVDDDARRGGLASRRVVG